jgi:two-component system LytT family response regulator
VVADDEILARRKLRDLLGGVDWLEWVGDAGDGDAALDLIARVRPDLVFLDIRMPGRSGLDVLRELPYLPLVIFTTAFDAHAVTAFELRALDYLVKPFSRQRLDAALERVRGSRPPAADLAERAGAALGDRVPEVIYVRDSGGLVAVPVGSIRRIESRDDYSAIFSARRTLLVLRRLTDLAQYLEPAGFIRVHRSHLVNRAAIAGLVRKEGGQGELLLTSGERIPVSRSRASALLAALPRL